MRDLHTQIKAWRFLEQPEALWAKILRHKYLHNKDFSTVNCNPRPPDSQFSKILLQNKQIILDEQKRVAGTGDNNDLFEDNWIPGVGKLSSAIRPSIQPYLTIGRIADLLTDEGGI